MLLEAFQQYEDETGTTGQPLWMTRSGDTQLNYVVEEYVDAAQAAIDDYDAAQAKKPEEQRAKGLQRYVRPVYIGTDDIPEGGLAREEFWRMMEENTAEQNNPYAGVDADILELIKPDEDEPALFDPSLYGDGV